MNRNSNNLASYGKIANAENNPLKQIVLLYDGAIRFLNLTAADIESGDLVSKAADSNRVLDILSYLQSILDFKRGGDIAPVLDTLYRRITVLVLRGSGDLDAGLMRHAAKLLAPVRDAWAINAEAMPHAEQHSHAAARATLSAVAVS